MKNFARNLFLWATAGMLATSCLSDEDPFSSGFQFVKPSNVYTMLYANNTRDSIIMVSWGKWMLTTVSSDDSWFHPLTTSGEPNAIYAFPVNFDQNTTGRSRYVQCRLVDTEHTEVQADFVYWQYATRGDGSLGSAPLVKGIKSSDGYEVSIRYDALCRPLSLTTQNAAGVKIHNISVVYDEGDSLITVRDGYDEMKAKMDKGYQTERLVGERDTAGYYSQYGNYGIPLSANQAFNFEQHKRGGDYQAFAYLLNGQSLYADSIHNADSLRYQRWMSSQETSARTEKLKLVYSQNDNRCQSVDVNQLLLGMEDCNPMLLLSMFRYTRNCNIIARASSDAGDIVVTTELNADKSVSRLIVKDERLGTETEYIFSY